jgi:signal transduction histidine kinase/ligand-binding sensor domain-containing protein/CheY-like chemotaxis protein/AraC-like DNA-binding protein
MKKLISFIIGVVLFSCFQQVKAQIGKFYSTDRELSNSLINHVYQDKRGFIWISTEDGLNKFDGNKFTIYKHNPDDTASIAVSYIRSVIEDSRNRFWVLGLNVVQLYERDTDSFRVIPFQLNEGIRTPHTTAIIERKNKEIWISTQGQGVMKLENNRFIPLDEVNTIIETLNIEMIYEDREQNIWINTKDKGLFLYSPTTRAVRRFTAQKQLTSETISSFTEDETGQLFIGTLNGGLMRLNRNKMTFEPVPYRNKTDLNIKTLMTDSQNRLYIGTEGNGVKQLDKENNRIVDCDINIGVFDLSSSKIHSILEDNGGNLWFGIFQKGLVFVPSMQNKFNYYGYKSFNKNSIGSDCVMSIRKDKKGTIWVGTDNDGLYAIDDDGNRLAHFKEENNNGSAPLSIMCILEDSQGQLWVGSYFNGLALIDKATGKSKYIRKLSGMENKGHNERVFCLMEDRNRHIWVGTYGSGVYKVSSSQQILAQYKSEKAGDDHWNSGRLCNDWINCIIQDGDGLLWIGTCNGLSCLNPETETFMSFPEAGSSLTKAFVHTMLEDRNGFLWIGTSEGLYRLDKKEKKQVLYTIEKGLPSNVICGIVEDDSGHLWISTHQGISRLVIETGTIVNFYASDGLQGNEFTRGAYFQDRQGKIYFGGTSGITSFFPDEITTQKKKLKVEITDFMLANRLIKKGDKAGGGGKNVITDTLVMDAVQFTLAYDHSSFSLDFSTMEFSTPEKIIYQYKLEGRDKDWVNTNPGTNRVSYTSLPPGKYTFLVRAKENENLSDIRKVMIVVTPPWYQTVWAILGWILILCAVMCGIIMYLLSRIRHKQQLMEVIHQEEINEAKLQFFINISHEIRTPLTLIIGPLEKLIAEAGQEVLPTYRMIYRNAQRILRLINQLMDVRKLDKGQMKLKFRETDIVGFINDLVQTFEYQVQKKNIKFTFVHEDKELKAWVDMNNFDKVLMNVFSNAFKHTPDNGEIEVRLTHGTDNRTCGPLKTYVEITVSDTGIGINKEEMERIFERFYQVNNALSRSASGTGIGLHLSRSLVELHHGTIKAENREDRRGARFIIRLPMRSDHLNAEELEDLPETSLKLQEKSDSQILPAINDEQVENKKGRIKTKYRVLIAEDDGEIRHYISHELGTTFHVSGCNNGKEALDMILREKIDLVISDIMMPEMDGITLCKRMKQNINISHIPVILLTAKARAEDRIDGLEVGADAYLVKPFNTEVLRTMVFNLIHNRERLKGQHSNELILEKKLEKMERKSNDEILMNKIIKIINDRISDPTLNVEALAACVGLSRVHVHRKLKELTHQTTKNFIRNIRLKQAASLLVRNNLSVSEVAYATGFISLSHFSNAFKDFYGVSPTEYRGKTEDPADE